MTTVVDVSGVTVPLKTWDTKADFDAAYSAGVEPEGTTGRPEVVLHYNRYAFLAWHRKRMINVAAALGWTSGKRLVIAGCAFGWSLETLLDELGFAQVLGVDTSAYTNSNLTTNEDAEIAAAITAVGLNPASGEGLTLFNRFRDGGGPRSRKNTLVLNENLSSNASRNRVRNAMGAPHTYEIFTEDMLTSLTDAECLLASQNAHQVSNGTPPGRVSHLVTTTQFGGAPGYNNKTLEQWKALIPADTFVEVESYRVL